MKRQEAASSLYSPGGASVGEKNLTQQLESFGNILVKGDPGFLDLKNGNLRLASGSPALRLGFTPIPYEKIGLFVDEWRTSLPR